MCVWVRCTECGGMCHSIVGICYACGSRRAVAWGLGLGCVGYIQRVYYREWIVGCVGVGLGVWG